MELCQLINECKKGSITAQKNLYNSFSVHLFLICRRYLKTDTVAEEILQNGYLKIFYSLKDFKYTTDAACIAWMKKIIVNECLQELRKKNSFFLVAEESAYEIADENDIIGQLSAEEIYRFITTMPVGYRTVFNLYVIEGYSHQEIANLLHIAIGTSKSQLNKARKMLQDLIKKSNQYASVNAR